MIHTVHIHKNSTDRINPLLLSVPIFVFFLIVFYYVVYVKTSDGNFLETNDNSGRATSVDVDN